MTLTIILLEPVPFRSTKPWWWAMSFGVRLVSRSPFSHCAVEVGGRVCEARDSELFCHQAADYYDHLRRIGRRYKTVLVGDCVPVGNALSIPRRRRWVDYHARLLLHFFSRGRFPAVTCVTPVRELVRLPQWVTCPGRLADWLYAHGHLYSRRARGEKGEPLQRSGTSPDPR
tara:strand:+ start:4710 stop:5225 length:516 start_codon:yes stop_codon:yes gene_type:complete